MSEQAENNLTAMFAAAESSLPAVGADDKFTADVMEKTEAIKRKLVLQRAVLALGLALLSIPLEDAVLTLSGFLMTSIVEMDEGLVAELLAPVNTVGGLLTVILLALRVAHKHFLK